MFTIIGIVSTSLMFIIGNLVNSSYLDLLKKSSINRLIFLSLSNIIFFYLSKLVIKFRDNKAYINKKHLLLLLVTPIASGLFLLYILSLTVNYNINTTPLSFYYSIYILIVICNIQSYWLYYKLSKDYEKELRYTLMSEKYKMQLQSSEEINQLYKESVHIRHDLKNHFAVIVGFINTKNYDKSIHYIDRILNENNEKANYVDYCENEYINYIVNQKVKICNKKNIALKLSIYSFLKSDDHVELGVLIGNLLDNAIEASEKTQEKFIYLTISDNDGVLTIMVKNSIVEPVCVINPNLETTKADKKMHGIGLSSVKRVVKQYNGTINYFEENNSFYVYVTLCL